MPRNGAQKKVEIPNDLYDNLDQTDQDIWDWIASLGFRPDKDERGQWFGLETQGDRKLGPFESLSVLGQQVQEAVNTDAEKGEKKTGKVIKLSADHRGNPYLPGAEEEVDAELAAFAGNHYALKQEHGDLTRRLKTAKTDLIKAAHDKRDLFKPDPDNTADKIYPCGGITVRIHNDYSEKITTEPTKTEE